MENMIKINNERILINGLDITSKIKLSSYDFKLLNKNNRYKQRLIKLIRQNISKRIVNLK